MITLSEAHSRRQYLNQRQKDGVDTAMDEAILIYDVLIAIALGAPQAAELAKETLESIYAGADAPRA